MLIFFIVLFSGGIGYLVSYIPQRQQISSLSYELSQAKKIISSTEEKLKGKNQQIAKQINDKKTTLPVDTVDVVDTTGAGVFFTYEKRILPEKNIQIDIYLKGDTSTQVDATDLILTPDSTIQIKDLKKGTVFPAYPRLLHDTSSVIITGIAVPSGSSLTYGKPNEIFATLILSADSKGSILLDKTGTGVFFNGQPIIELGKSFVKIDL